MPWAARPRMCDSSGVLSSRSQGDEGTVNVPEGAGLESLLPGAGANLVPRGQGRTLRPHGCRRCWRGVYL